MSFELFTPTILLLTLGATLLAGLAKAGFGGALASSAVPLMALGMSPLLAVSILLPILCAIDAFTVRAYWRQWHMPSVWVLVPAALLGITVGALTFQYISDDGLRLMIGVVAVTFAVRQLQQRYLPLGASDPAIPGPWPGRFWGVLAGFTSHVAHAGGVPLSVWLIAQRLGRKEYVATSAIFFLFANYAKLLPYGLNGQFTAPVLSVAAVMIPVAVLSVVVGVRVNRFVPDRMFYLIVCIGLLITGLKLLYDAGLALL